MKNIKTCIFALGMAFVLAACTGNNSNKSAPASEPASDPVSEPEESKPFTLHDPEDTSMVTEKVKAYIDAMREQERLLDDPFKYDDLFGEDGVTVEDYLDEGEVNGQNRTVNGQIPDRSDKNPGILLKFDVKEGYEAERYTVEVSKDADFQSGMIFTTDKNELLVDNLLINQKYYWKVYTSEGTSDVHDFTTGDYVRWINARPMYNVRDNGGYMTSSGKRVKQGLVFRGGEITNMNGNGHYVTIADSSKEIFRYTMDIGVELDLRGASDISDGYKACAFAIDGDIEYQQYAIKSYEQTFTQTRSSVAPIFEILKNADQKHVYYHCFGGADRTGTIGFLLNGLLGVSYTDLVIDFELTSYSSINNEHIRNHIPGHQHQYDRWPALINQLKTDTTGGYAWDDNAALKDNIENFLVKACSVPQDTIDTIRDIMLED